MKVLITGSNGLIGSEAAKFYLEKGWKVTGIDNNSREKFFGPAGSTLKVRTQLEEEFPNYSHLNLDITDWSTLVKALANHSKTELVIHCAAQPSHDRAASMILEDFAINAQGTLNMLEVTRSFFPEAVFIHMSTNKVYGDSPNELPIVEKETRWDYINPSFDIDETMSIDQSTHSLFGVSKTAGDLLAQEYGRYFGLKTGIFRGGCLTGPQHAGVKLHGFLSYLVKCVVSETPYTIFGYKGKQVRDQIHCKDVIAAFEAFRQNPRPGEVYNLGGCRINSISVLEAIMKIETIAGKKLNYSIVEDNRIGDHICYISNMNKFKQHYPDWKITMSLDEILDEMVKNELL